MAAPSRTPNSHGAVALYHPARNAPRPTKAVSTLAVRRQWLIRRSAKTRATDQAAHQWVIPVNASRKTLPGTASCQRAAHTATTTLGRTAALP